MTTDDILRLGEEADALADKEIAMPGEHHPDWHDVRDRHFAALVAAAEREACAISCEVNAARWIDSGGKQWGAAHECADAIRARGKT